MKYYLAYGSNLNVPQMAVRCPGAVPVGVAVIEDYELLYKGSRTGSYLTIEPAEGCRVPVAVWKVSADHEKALDAYEGFPSFYYKKDFRLKVRYLSSGRECMRDCFAYIMDERRHLGIPSPWYVDVCRQGYRVFDFDPAYLERAYERSSGGVWMERRAI